MKKLFFLLFPLWLFANDLDERVRHLEEQMKQISTETATKTFGANFVRENFGEGWLGLFLTGDLLYWHTKIGGTEYAYDLLSDAIGFTRPVSGKVEDHDFNWDVGFRFGGGLCFPGIAWEIGVIGTRFSTSETETWSKQLPSILINLRGLGLNPSHEIRSHDSVSYTDILIELKKHYFLSRLLSTYTTIGARRSWIDQEQKVVYDPLEVKDTSCFSGVGPRVGFGTRWHLFWGLSLIADLAGSLLYGDFDVKHKEQEVDLTADTHLFSPSLELMIGLGWDIYTKSYHFGLTFAYEAFYVWRQNQALQLEDTVNTRIQLVRFADDLTFYGLTARVKLEF